MVKVLLKTTLDDPGVLAMVADLDISGPHVLTYDGSSFIKSHVPSELRLCGSCQHLKSGAPRDLTAAGWHCFVDSKEVPCGAACRNGGFVPEVIVYRRARRLTVVLAPTPEVEETQDPSSVTQEPSEVTAIVPKRGRQLGRNVCAAMALFFTAAVMGTIWVLQRMNG
jgi:hypothetical protein